MALLFKNSSENKIFITRDILHLMFISMFVYDSDLMLQYILIQTVNKKLGTTLKCKANSLQDTKRGELTFIGPFPLCIYIHKGYLYIFWKYFIAYVLLYNMIEWMQCCCVQLLIIADNIIKLLHNVLETKAFSF